MVPFLSPVPGDPWNTVPTPGPFLFLLALSIFFTFP